MRQREERGSKGFEWSKYIKFQNIIVSPTKEMKGPGSVLVTLGSYFIFIFVIHTVSYEVSDLDLGSVPGSGKKSCGHKTSQSRRAVCQ